jgi:hypothetical protein
MSYYTHHTFLLGFPTGWSFTTHHLSLGAHGFLAFGAPSSAILFGGMVVEEKRRSCNCGGFWRGKWVYVAHFGGKRN